jgi:hypothetical protein
VRVLFLLAAFVLLTTFAPPAMQRRDPPPPVTLISFRPIALDEADPAAKRLGRLVWLGGWALTSNDRRLGGISALHVEGGEALALSDAGWLIRLPLPDGRSAVRARISMVEAGPGPAGVKVNRDIESAVVEGNRIWLAYEQANAVWRYDRTRFEPRSSAAPARMARWSANRGPEAMARLADGRFLVFAEGGGGDSEAVLFAGDPSVRGTRATRLRYRPPAGYRITDSARLPDGRLVLLNRSVSLFTGFTATLTILAVPRELKEGMLISGEEAAAFRGPVTRDNLEALSVTEEAGRTILWLASDDNYSPFQRTLLMKFALAE